MTRTPDEIKKGLECCVDGNIVCAGNCVFDDDVKLGYPDCVKLLMTNAIALIRQLEATVSEKEKVVAELSGKIGQLEVERDAAVNDLHFLLNHPLSAGPCYACLHSKDCWRGGDCDPVNNDRWQWRGICKEEH